MNRQAVAFVLALSACRQTHIGPDASDRPDASADGGPPDAGLDAGPADAGLPDAGLDAGIPVVSRPEVL